MATFLATMPLWAKLLVGLVPAIAAGISGIASYNASRETNSTNVRLTNENNALQMQLAGQANDWSIEQWNRENQFNNPIAQRMRLESAGINPALIYGNGGLVNEAASSPAVTMANTRAAQVATPTIPDPMTAAQIANLNAQTESLQHNTEREDEKQVYNLKLLQRDIRLKDGEIALNAQTINKLSSEEQLNYAMITRIAVQNTIDQQVADKQCELWNSTIGLQNKEAALRGEEYRQLVAFFNLREENLRASNAELWSRVGVNKSDIARMDKLVSLYDKQIEQDYSADMFKFRKELVDNQSKLAKNQAAYWDDYKKDPSKYRPHTHSVSHSQQGGNQYYNGGFSDSETITN